MAIKKSQFHDLPFVGKNSLWEHDVPNDYLEACDIGYNNAIAFVQYLHEHPEEIGSNLLGIIVKDIDFNDREFTGVWVGFFTEIEILAARW